MKKLAIIMLLLSGCALDVTAAGNLNYMRQCGSARDRSKDSATLLAWCKRANGAFDPATAAGDLTVVPAPYSYAVRHPSAFFYLWHHLPTGACAIGCPAPSKEATP